MKTYQVAIIGGGPAGYSAAEKAGNAGLSVILFEKRALGGVCLNDGCIPTKTLLYSAKLYDSFKESKKYAVEATDPTYNFKKIFSRKNKVVRKLVLGIKAKMQSAQVDVIEGEAKLTGANTIMCNNEEFQFENLLVCSGSETFIPPINGINEVPYWTHEDALSAKEQPESLIIVGGGVIGIEFASFYNSLGTKVTVVEMMDEILPMMDAECVKLLKEEYEKRGVEFLTQTKVECFANQGDLIAVDVQKEGENITLTAEKVLVSVGRRSKLVEGMDKLNFEKNERGQILFNEQMQSSLKNTYLCGDANGKSLLAHTAIREAHVAINTILGKKDAMSYRAIPGIVYTNPEIAGVGCTTTELDKANIPYEVRSIPMTYSGRFVAENEGFTGLSKLIIEKGSQRILGAHLLGNPASEIITLAAMAIEQNLTTKEWDKLVFPHPTVTEIFKDLL